MLFSMLLLIIILILFMFLKVDSSESSFESTNMAMGTYVHQTVYGKHAEEAAERTIQEINNLENLISWRIETSDIAKINQSAGKEWIDVDKKTIDILTKSLEVSKKSMGSLDSTILPISCLWGFDTDQMRVPSDEDIQKTLLKVNYRNLKVNHETNKVKLFKENTGINLGAVGKGAACDEAIKTYKKAGAKSGIIAVGGSVGVFGTKPNKADWRIAIRDPYKGTDDSNSIAILEVKRGFVSTSGAYEKNFYDNGKFYHHILDPKTGYPSNSDLLSVSVLHENGLITDLLSTACYVLGRENSQEILKNYGASAVFVDKEKHVYVTDNIKNNIIITNEEYSIV